MTSNWQAVQYYSIATQEWSESKRISIHDESGQRLCVVPLDFLLQAAVEPLKHLRTMVGMCVNEEGVLVTEQGTLLSTLEQLESTNNWIWKCSNTKRCSFFKGPRFKFAHRAPLADEDDASTMSDSSRDSDTQNRYKELLVARDGECILSGTTYKKCTAMHIIPQSRPEYYEEILGRAEVDTFQAQHGFLVRRDWHAAFDRGEWALWPNGDDFIVHFFMPVDEQERAFHGKCVLKHLRGFSAGFKSFG